MDVGGEPVVARNGPHAGRFHEQVLDVASRNSVDSKSERSVDRGPSYPTIGMRPRPPSTARSLLFPKGKR